MAQNEQNYYETVTVKKNKITFIGFLEYIFTHLK